MSQERLLSMLRSRRGPEVASLDEYFQKSGQEVFDRMNDVARRTPGAIDEEALAWALKNIAHSPASVFFLLINIAAGDEARRDATLARYRELMKEHPGPALRVAGIHLHEYNRLLDGEWIDAADRLFDHEPEGAWGIFESAAMYRPKF